MRRPDQLLRLQGPERQAAFAPLPSVAEAAARAAKLPEIKPPTPTSLVAPVQDTGTRPSRALPYAPAVDGRVRDWGHDPDPGQYRRGGDRTPRL
ncbi:hypothetical protein ACRAWD_28375 [Caulobacter segnis]